MKKAQAFSQESLAPTGQAAGYGFAADWEKLLDKQVAAPVTDELARDEERDIEREAQLQKLSQEREIHRWRVSILVALFILILVWLAVVVCFVERAGRVPADFKSPSFHLSDGVLIAFITSTTANVLGLFYIAGRWLYPTRRE